MPYDDSRVVPKNHRRLTRSVIASLVMAVPMTLISPFSPLFRRAFVRGTNAARAEFMTRSFATILPSTFMTYRFTLDPDYCTRILPQLTPLTGVQFGALSLLCAHCLYPGVIVLYMEPTWRLKISEYITLTRTVTLAYYPRHCPAMLALGFLVGTLLYPVREADERDRRADGDSASKHSGGRGGSAGP